jgi:ABC-type multidrug transport system fused ATPase/permease subunit
MREVWVLVSPHWGILAAGLILMAINRTLKFVPAVSTKYFIDDVVIQHRLYMLLPIASAISVAALLQGVATLGLNRLLARSSHKIVADLRVKVQTHVGRLPVAFYDSNKTGVLISRIMSDVEGIRNLLGNGLISLVGSLTTAIIALIVLFQINVVMTIVALALLACFDFGLRMAFRLMHPISSARTKINAEVIGHLNETLGGVRIVKCYRAEKREAQTFASGVQRLFKNSLDMVAVDSMVMFGTTGLVGIISTAIMLLGAHQILSHRMLLGTYVMYTMFLGMLLEPISHIASLGPSITEALAGLERTREVLHERPEDEDARRTLRLERINGHVSFENVCFGYDANKQVLHEISFKAEPDTVTALVGPSGAGKSTIIGLIAAFYAPNSGRILIDGNDLSEVKLDSYRAQLGVVLQEPFIFDGSILENVGFGRPEASIDAIISACRVAHVDEFAEEFQNGYETMVGERGVKLSGGQKQRVSIARAILANPRILILDEATSNLDSESEALIQEGLRFLMRYRTTFVIAHRLCTIRRADQILVVEAGHVVESGTHELLCAARGRYYDFYERQFRVEAVLPVG